MPDTDAKNSEPNLDRRPPADSMYNEDVFRVLVDTVDEYAIFALDPEGVIRTWNKGAQRLKGYSAGDVIGTHFRRFYLPSDIARKHPEHELELAAKNGKYEEEGWRLRKDGSRFWANVLITALRAPDGRLRGFAKVTRDLTERKLADEKLRDAYASLEARVEERTRDLAAAMAQAEAAIKARDQFFSLASHELKTPLTSLVIQAQLRLRKAEKGQVQEFAPGLLPDLFATDVRLLQRLAHLVDRMLDVSRISSGKLELNVENFDLAEMAHELVGRLTPILQASGNEVRLRAPAEARGNWDRLGLEQVLTNLLTNAGKYAPGKPIEVAVSVSHGHAAISVKDEGPGIPRESQARIFEPFMRADNYHQLGLGLGLYVVKRITELHGGAVRVESEPGRGATFFVQLPLG